MPAVTLVVETHNLSEHSSLERLEATLRAATATARRHGDARVLLVDGSATPQVAALVEARFGDVERHPVDGAAGYDEAKRRAAATCGTPIVAYLDGDCLPSSEDWLRLLVAPIAAGDVVATAGSTTYEAGPLSRLLTLMDFGFLLPGKPHPVPCYASNNVAFASRALAETPVPDGDMRCHCYAHAQRLARMGTPVVLVPDARVRHQTVPLVTERLRRGWDLVAAARVDPELRVAPWLRYGVAAAPLFWLAEVQRDVRRLARHGGDLGLRIPARLAALPVLVALRMIDAVGIVAALRGRPTPQI